MGFSWSGQIFMDPASAITGVINATVIRSIGMHQLKTDFIFSIVGLPSNMDFQALILLWSRIVNVAGNLSVNVPNLQSELACT